MANTKSRKMMDVQVLETRGDSALFQYMDGDGHLHRAYLPISDIEGNKVDREVLDQAIPHGLPWADLLDLSGITPQLVEQELHRRGIWTLEDLQANDRQLIRIGTELITKAVRAAAEKGKGLQ